MPDIFKATVPFDADDDEAVWAVSNYVASYVTTWASKLDGHAKANAFMVTDRGGSSLERDDIDSLRAAARENHLTPARLHTSVHFKRGLAPLPEDAREIDQLQFNLEIDMLADLEVNLWSEFSESYSGPNVKVMIESNDRLVRDGLEAQLLGESAHLKRESDAAAQANLSAQSTQSNTFHGPVNVGIIGNGGHIEQVGTIGESERSGDGTPSADSRSWWSRTWQDHTATFIITVVGGIIVIGGATWLGLQPS